jgi:hypothetical protein
MRYNGGDELDTVHKYGIITMKSSHVINVCQFKRVEQVLPGSRVGGGGVAQIMYTHVSKCKNDKIKLKNKKILNKTGEGAQW